VYYEIADSLDGAFTREKQLKKWNRDWKVRLIEGFNPEWKDLYSDL
jgi:putative endonuclease